MTIGDRIKKRRIQLGLSQQDIAEKLGYAGRSSINKIELNQRDLPQSKIKAIADALDTSPGYIMGWTDVELPSNIILLPEEKFVPLIGDIACGEPILAEQNIEFYVRADKDMPADFALRCKGDSMINARIFDGDIVYLRSQSDVDDGEIAAVVIGDEATLKKVRKMPGKVILSPCNPMYDDLIYQDEQLETVRIIGKAVAFTSVVR